PRTRCGRWLWAARTGSISAASKPRRAWPPFSRSSRAAAVSGSRCATTSATSSPGSPTARSPASPRSPPPPGSLPAPHAKATRSAAQPRPCWFRWTHTLQLNPGHHGQRLAKVGLRLPGRVRQRHEHLLSARPARPHVVLHDGVAAPVAVLLTQPVEDPLRRMPLLCRPPLILLQHGVDHARPLIQLRPPRRLFPPVARRHRIAQHLAHRLAGQPKLRRHTPLALAFHHHRSPHPTVELHSVHPPGVS